MKQNRKDLRKSFVVNGVFLGRNFTSKGIQLLLLNCFFTTAFLGLILKPENTNFCKHSQDQSCHDSCLLSW